MSWIVADSLTWIQRMCVNILKAGPIPRHIAFIMDGNRRYARKANIDEFKRDMGFDTVRKTLQWCKELGINEVTVYGFSIDNFKRCKEEIDVFMALAKKKFEQLLEEIDKIHNSGLCVRFIGNFSYISPEIQKLISKIMLMTENNNKCFLNIAFSYTSRDEITNSIKCVVDGASKGLLNANDIDEELLSKCMYTNKSPDPDFVIRTSGEVRFSDFLLWQISCAQVLFTDVLWPELSIWSLFAAVFKYQTNYNDMLSIKNAKKHCTQNKDSNQHIDNFVDELNRSRRYQLENFIKM